MYKYNQVPSVKTLKTEESVRRAMSVVYGYLSAGLAIAAGVAYAVVHSSLIYYITNPVVLIAMSISPCIIQWYLYSRIDRISVDQAQLLFVAIVTSVGISLSVMQLMFKASDLISIFLITSSVFLSAAIYGSVTKRDMTEMSSFLFMGLVGLIVTSLIRMFVQNTKFHVIHALFGVIVFVCFTAYDISNIKQVMYRAVNIHGADSATISKISIIGALQLFYDFINSFIYIARLFSIRKNNDDR